MFDVSTLIVNVTLSCILSCHCSVFLIPKGTELGL